MNGQNSATSISQCFSSGPRFGRALAWPIVLLLGVAVAQAEPVRQRDLGDLYLENVPETPPELAARLRPYVNVRSASFADWLANGGLLVRSRLAETTQLFRVSAPGHRREQLTFFDEPVLAARAFDRGGEQAVALMRDQGGNENYQVFTFRPDCGDCGADQIVSDGHSRHGGLVRSRDGRFLAYYSTRRNGRDWDIYLADPATGTEREVLRAEGAWIPLDFSPDGSALLVLKYISNLESKPYRLMLDSGELTPIAKRDEPTAFRDLRFGRHRDEVLGLSNLGREFFALYRFDLAAGRGDLLYGSQWDIEQMDIAANAAELVVTINEAGYGRLLRLSTASGQPLPLPELPDGVISSPVYSPDGRRLAFNFSSFAVAGDVFTIDLDAGRLDRWTYSEIGGLNADRFIEPELIGYPSFDQVAGQARSIPAWVYRPRRDAPHPVIIDIHGGPASQRRAGFSANAQFWTAELGVATIAPNVRGSSGYGNTWISLDDGRLREDSVRDIGALLDWIAAQPDLDAQRVMVYGGSYGGYMVLASLMHYGERLAGGINIVGISHFVTFLENTSDYRRDLRRVEYGDERDREMREFLHAISPATHPERLTRPLLVIQGLNDPRVPVSESEQIIEAMRSAGHNPWYMLARNEGHGFRRQSNRLARSQAEALFIQEVLLGDQAARQAASSTP